MTVRDICEGRLNETVARLSCLLDDFDLNGKLTKAELIQKIREEVASVIGWHFDMGFEIGLGTEEDTFDPGESVMDFVIEEEDDDDDDVDDMDRPDFEG